MGLLTTCTQLPCLVLIVYMMCPPILLYLPCSSNLPHAFKCADFLAGPVSTVVMLTFSARINMWSSVVIVAVLYICVSNMIRFLRMRKMHSEFGYTTRGSLAKMSIGDAQKIQKYLFRLEFPFTTQKALEFALFRTYGIPSISSLLVHTTQLSDPLSASKRVEDTKILVAEFLAQAPSSDRALSAIARMNYIHSLYQKSGRISNYDMLYTLSLFALEPIRWVDRYEWRNLTDMEKCAIGVFWKAMGDAMKIDFKAITPAPAGWQDGLAWLSELESWSIAYERECMVPDVNNKKTADQTTSILLWRVPTLLRGLGLQAVSALMDTRLRKAMMFYYPVHRTTRDVADAGKGTYRPVRL